MEATFKKIVIRSSNPMKESARELIEYGIQSVDRRRRNKIYKK